MALVLSDVPHVRSSDRTQNSLNQGGLNVYVDDKRLWVDGLESPATPDIDFGEACASLGFSPNTDMDISALGNTYGQSQADPMEVLDLFEGSLPGETGSDFNPLTSSRMITPIRTMGDIGGTSTEITGATFWENCGAHDAQQQLATFRLQLQELQLQQLQQQRELQEQQLIEQQRLSQLQQQLFQQHLLRRNATGHQRHVSHASPRSPVKRTSTNTEIVRKNRENSIRTTGNNRGKRRRIIPQIAEVSRNCNGDRNEVESPCQDKEYLAALQERVPPRPKNAFMLWAQQHRRIVQENHKDLPNAAISTLLGKMWKEQPPEIRQTFKDQAAAGNKRHKEEHPDYKYNGHGQPARLRNLLEKRLKDFGIDISTTSAEYIDFQKLAVGAYPFKDATNTTQTPKENREDCDLYGE